METSNLFKAKMSESIELRDLPESVTNNIQIQVDRLRQEYRYILNCQVDIKLSALLEDCYHIQIIITLPNGDLIVDRSPNPDYYQEDIYVAIWSAFNLARKKLQEHSLQAYYAMGTSPIRSNLRPPTPPLRRSFGYAGA